MHTHSKRQENYWNFVFSVLFIFVLIGALWFMKHMRGGFLNYVSPYDALLLALASFRVTRLVVYDKISRWFRDLFDGSGSGLKHTVHDLLGCPWCISFWSALVLVVLYFVFDWAWTVIFFLTVAGVGSLVQLYANGIGWRAENLKLDAKEKEANLKAEIDPSSLGS
jgi:heme/copper-type cytochrome/quinol oxidase subunit 4